MYHWATKLKAPGKLQASTATAPAHLPSEGSISLDVRGAAASEYSGFRVWGAGLRVFVGFTYRVQGVGFRV